MNDTEGSERGRNLRSREGLEIDGPELASKVHAAVQGLSPSDIADFSEHLEALRRVLSVVAVRLSESLAETIDSGEPESGSRSVAEPRWAHSTETDSRVPAHAPAAKSGGITFDQIVDLTISLLSGTPTPPSVVASFSPGEAPTIETITGDEMRLLRYLDPQMVSRWHTPSGGDEELLTSDQLAARMGLKTRQSVHNWLRQRRVIGWRGAKRQYVFPADQIDERGRPLTGIEPIFAHFGDGYAAWVWLTTPLPALDGQEPLQLLRTGERDRVMVAVQGDMQGDFA